ncbi:MAG: lipoprotein [Sphingomonadales bacterium]
MTRMLLVTICMTFLLSGCGRKGDLEPPPAALPDAADEQTGN